MFVRESKGSPSQRPFLYDAWRCASAELQRLLAKRWAGAAYGLAPDSLSSVYLATRAKVLLAPAMNGKMWEHPSTQRNVAQLKADGCHFIGPEASGMLACGYEGAGRLVPLDLILTEFERLLTTEGTREV